MRKSENRFTSLFVAIQEVLVGDTASEEIMDAIGQIFRQRHFYHTSLKLEELDGGGLEAKFTIYIGRCFAIPDDQDLSQFKSFAVTSFAAKEISHAEMLEVSEDFKAEVETLM